MGKGITLSKDELMKLKEMTFITEFSKETLKQLGNYVYVYSDTDTKQPFYIGKGKGNRVFDHLHD